MIRSSEAVAQNHKETHKGQPSLNYFWPLWASQRPAFSRKGPEILAQLPLLFTLALSPDFLRPCSHQKTALTFSQVDDSYCWLQPHS